MEGPQFSVFLQHSMAQAVVGFFSLVYLYGLDTTELRTAAWAQVAARAFLCGPHLASCQFPSSSAYLLSSSSCLDFSLAYCLFNCHDSLKGPEVKAVTFDSLAQEFPPRTFLHPKTLPRKSPQGAVARPIREPQRHTCLTVGRPLQHKRGADTSTSVTEEWALGPALGVSCV